MSRRFENLESTLSPETRYRVGLEHGLRKKYPRSKIFSMFESATIMTVAKKDGPRAAQEVIFELA